MVAKGNKRTTSAIAVASSPKKKSRVDPMFAGIVATLQGTDELSEQCRDMLVAMVAPSLSTLKGERHSVQQLGVAMIEETLKAHQKKLIEALEVAQKGLSDLEGSKSTLLQSLENAKASLEEKQAAKLAAGTAHKDAKESRKVAEAALAEAADQQTKAEATHATLEEEKAAIDGAYQEHFKIPMDADEGPHHSFLKPFIESLGLEDSLSHALPSSCVKAKEERGGFDNLVLTELGKAFISKIEALEKLIVDGVSKISECKAAVISAEEVVAEKTLSEKATATSLEMAAIAHNEAETEVCKASEAWATFEPRVQEATENQNLHDVKRMDFEEGPLKTFETLRDKVEAVPAEQEAASLGA